MSNTLHMKVGENLGEILLDISQNKILSGNPEEAFKVYEDALQGFTKEYALMCLTNAAVLKTTGDGEVSLTDDVQDRIDNQKNILDWNLIMRNKLDTLNAYRSNRLECIKQFQTICYHDIDDYNIIDMMEQYLNSDELANIGIHNIAAKLIAGGGFNDNLHSNGEYSWEVLQDNVEYDNATKYEKILYWTVKYVDTIRSIHKSYLEFAKAYSFLIENDLCKRIPCIEMYMENTCYALVRFADNSKGYYHPMCNTKLYDYKNQIINDLLETTFGNDYIKYGILKKDIMDGYDAGWLSPEGDFYGDVGETSAMIHMNLADDLFKKRYNKQMLDDGVTEFGNLNPDNWLEKNGWIKIHHDDIYGSFIGERDPNKRTKEFPYHYCPTEIQIKMVCDYADKFYGGKFYTEANALGRTRHPNPYTTYAVRQMDEFKLHDIFGF